MCEKLQIKMYKIILGVNTKTTNSAVRSELGRFPMHIPILSSTFKYLYHLLSDHSDSPLLMNALRTSISLHSNGTVSWFSSVVHLLNLGCLDYQTLALSFSTKKKYLINRLRKELEKLYVDQWENERQNIIRKQQKSKLELYSNIKTSYRRETYIDDVRDIQTRKCITQTRLSAHKFPIEQGRYKNIYPESNEYATYVVTILLEMNSLLHNTDRLL